ncbi:MAG: hypothetical protein ACRDHD_02725 [Candidatus Limnocylindria bacterium]
MRSVLALLGGIATSVIGLVVVLGSELDLAGALLIASGAAIAVLGLRGPQPRTDG